MDVMERIDKAVKENPVMIFMKGTPQQPECGFSAKTLSDRIFDAGARVVITADGGYRNEAW